MAEEYSLELSLTTNAQFLDEEKFFELKDITREMLVSIDTHYPELFEKIRPGSKPEKVFENLAARRGALPGTRPRGLGQHRLHDAQRADARRDRSPTSRMPGLQTMNVLQMIDVNGRSGHLDPTLHFSADYVEWIKQRCIQVAKREARAPDLVRGRLGALRLPHGEGRVEAARGTGRPAGRRG